jgi:DNA-binding transcriptional LysR family regulator
VDKVRQMASFVAVVEAGSFVAAAEATGLSKAAISRHIGDLEHRLGVRLLQRTTRRLSLTAEGRTFHERAKDLLAEIDAAEAELTSRSAEPRGLIRVNAPLTFGILHLAPLWARFADIHKAVTLDIVLNDRIVDIVEEGYDLAIRIAAMTSSTLVSRKLASTRTVLCASPTYLRKHGRPTHPRDIASHLTISYSYLSTGDEWRFIGPKGPISVRIKSRIHTNSGATCRIAALDHQGIILEPDFLVGDDLRRGDLVELMPKYQGAEFGIHAMYPTRKHLPLKVRVLVDFLVEAFREPAWHARTAGRKHG